MLIAKAKEGKSEIHHLDRYYVFYISDIDDFPFLESYSNDFKSAIDWCDGAMLFYKEGYRYDWVKIVKDLLVKNTLTWDSFLIAHDNHLEYDELLDKACTDVFYGQKIPRIIIREALD